MVSVELTVSASGILVIVRFGAPTRIVAEAIKVPGLLLVEVTVAVFDSEPVKPAAVVPLTTKVTVAPAASVPRLSVTVLLLRIASGVPVGPLVLTELQVTPNGAGSGSLTLTL